MMKKKQTYPIRKIGKYSEYEEYEDGSIKIPPLYSQQIDDIIARREAADNFFRLITEQCHNKIYVPIRVEEVQFWNKMREDYDLDEMNNFTYNRNTKMVTRTSKPE